MELVVGLAMALSLALLLAGGVWIGISLFVTAFVVLQFFMDAPAGKILATATWGYIDSWTLTALPLFILMGELLFRTNLANQVFRALAPWTSYVPGGMLHVNIIGCGVFAAVCGSSTATTVTVGQITYPELTRRGYSESMIVGTLAGSGTFGLLIPPSIMMIVYGFIAEVSIVKLFIAGVLPGILLMGLFSLYVIIWSLLNPTKLPVVESERMSIWQMIYLGRYLFPVMTLIIGLMAVMYLGVATATEAAAVGVLAALAILIISGTFSWSAISTALLSSARTSCMIMFVLIGAAYFTAAMGFSGIPEAMGQWVAEQKYGQYQLIAALTVMYVVLGCFLDGVSMVVLTASAVLPMVQAAGIDLIWFGIYIVLVVEMSLITPPIGLNLYVLQNFCKRDAMYVARCAFPFFLLMVLAVALISVFPEIVMVLPNRM